MSESKQKVQFFQSESSFGSQSELSESRYYDFINQIISESQNIFLTLKKQLLPNQNLTKHDKIKFVITRAQIIYKDTIPEHIAYLNRIQAPENAKAQVKICSEKLKKLLEDYEKLKQGTMIYKQFYNLYGKQFGLQEGSFQKKKDLAVNVEEPEPIIQPEYIEINYNSNKQKFKGSTPRVLIASTPNNNEKEQTALKEEIHRLKKSSEDVKRKHETELINQRLIYEKRLRNYLLSQNSHNEEIQNLKLQLKIQSEKVTKSLEQNKDLMVGLQQNNRTIDKLKADNASLNEQIQALRKLDNSIMEEQQNHDKSYNSEYNETQDKKLSKKLKNLKQENELLKTQLKNQRQRLYKLQSDLTDEQKRQLQKNKRYVQKQKLQLQELYNNFDKQRIQILQLSHSNKNFTKLNETLKHENNELKKQLERLNSKDNQYVNLLSLPGVERSTELSQSHNKTQILEYQGDGIQGIPYYQNLTKEFKIRFRRSCLKQKQLLYKLNGIQIGTISIFEAPNKIDILVHITNYSENRYEKVKIKIMNANENKINGQSFQFPELASNEQIKLPISLMITRYPIGPLVLLFEYVSQRKEELRILLPAHIFKTMHIEQRTEKLEHGDNRVSIKTERKVAKDLNELKTYFKNIKINNGILQLSLYSEHTHTLIQVDLVQTHEGLDLFYKHKEGNRNITQYYVKTLSFLLSK